MGKWLSIGTAIGIGIGAAYGNIGMGIGIGLAIGIRSRPCGPGRTFVMACLLKGQWR
jgi:hypothetical protein